MELVISYASAIPNAVEIFPSIPASPRFANTKILFLNLVNASISRTGLDEPTNKALILVRQSQIQLMAACSDQVSFFTSLAANSEDFAKYQ